MLKKVSEWSEVSRDLNFRWDFDWWMLKLRSFVQADVTYGFWLKNILSSHGIQRKLLPLLYTLQIYSKNIIKTGEVNNQTILACGTQSEHDFHHTSYHTSPKLKFLSFLVISPDVFFITHQASNHTFTIKENAPMNTQSPQPSFLRHERLQCISASILFQFHWPAPTERGSLSSPRDSFMAFGYESFGGTWVVIKYWHLTLWWWLNMS